MTYKTLTGSTSGFPDTQAFIKSLRDLVGRVPLGGFLSANREVIVTRAPGRLDVMGGIADYSGSLVLQLPIAAAAHAALQKNNSKQLRLASIHSNADRSRVFEMSVEELNVAGNPIEYAKAREKFAAPSKDHWAAYVVGAVLVLMRETKAVFSEGFDILISSSVPEGKGVSSSAALEVSAMNAVAVAFNLNISPIDIALFCQKVENLVAGAACGVMDQMTSECAEGDRLLELRCQPCDFLGSLAIPDELEFWGLDSGIKHTVGGSAYTTVRTAAFMGYRIIADLAGFSTDIDANGMVHISDSQYNGYLANIPPEIFEKEFASRIPERMSGRQFRELFDGTTDSVTTVDPEVDYPVLQATQHPIYENDRVQTFGQLLRHSPDAGQLGDLMFASHRSYSRCGLGSKETDLIADLVRSSSGDDLFGARITGGGSGGTVAILGRRGNLAAVDRIAREYAKRSGYRATLISGSSSGAKAFQHLKLQ
jgi:L-arabinokinase